MIDSLLATKLYTPIFRPELVSRNRLIEQLDDGLHRKLTLVSAPAGFGKTTLITEWTGKISNGNAKVQVGWLSLDEGDNDPTRFLSYFIFALRHIEGLESLIGKTALNLLQSAQIPPAKTIITEVINDFTSLNSKIVLVLDDFHLIESEIILDAMNFWIENSPTQVHLVILTREDPPFPLARLRAGDLMTELRSDDLRFSRQEAAHFLNYIMGLNLDSKSVAVLEERTEGWVAGLQMAALSMRNLKDVSGFIERFSGTNRFILDYLLEEVLANQPAEIQNFLLNTSILKRLTAPLCDTVLANDGFSDFALGYLDRTNLFLVSLDDERSWYRYHHLFADLLRAQLPQIQTGIDLADLHSRAAQWYETNGFTYDAIYHASLIPNIDWVERLIEQNYMEIFQRKDSATIRYWTGELSKELIYNRPSLCIHEANSRAWLGQIEDAELLLNEAEKRLLLADSKHETNELLGHLAYVRSRVTAMRGNFIEAIKLCINALKYTPASNQALLGGIGVMLGYAYFLDGNFKNAVQTLNETIQTGKLVRAINTTIGAYCVLARLYAIQGQLHKSYEIYLKANIFIKDTGEQHRGAQSIVDAGIAEILYEWNDLEAARKHIMQALDAIPLWSKADDTALALITLSRIQQAYRESTSAQKSIEKGLQEINTKGVFPESRDTVLTADVKQLLAYGEYLAIAHWERSIENRIKSENPFRFENETSHIIRARVYIFQKKLDAAVTLLTQLEESADSGRRTGRLVEIIILKALALQEKGEAELAADALKNCLALAEPAGYIRIFVNEGDPMKQLITRWLAKNGERPQFTYAHHLLSQFEKEPHSGNAPQLEISPSGNLIEPLSPRELEVLQLIALGNTNKEIASKLVVSPGTIKAHTSSIYRKLDVVNRTEAVACARRLEIIP